MRPAGMGSRANSRRVQQDQVAASADCFTGFISSGSCCRYWFNVGCNTNSRAAPVWEL
jgi:hypothetical protein